MVQSNRQEEWRGKSTNLDQPKLLQVMDINLTFPLQGSSSSEDVGSSLPFSKLDADSGLPFCKLEGDPGLPFCKLDGDSGLPFSKLAL
jgi:hypothetical protein